MRPQSLSGPATSAESSGHGKMSALQELSPMQMSEALVAAAEKQIPVTVMLHRGEVWLNMRSRFLAIDGARLIFELPRISEDKAIDDLVPAEKFGVSFKHKHHKHLFGSTLLALQSYQGSDGEIRAVAVGCPTTMQRIQRRAYYRVSVPSNHIVRVSLWFGGRETEPSGTTPDRPVWSGKVEDISSGGFQVRTRDDVGMALDIGDMVGLRMTFGLSAETLFADAQFRHNKPTADGSLLGFQFVGLGQTAESKNALRIISSKVSEYQRLELRHRAPS